MLKHSYLTTKGGNCMDFAKAKAQHEAFWQGGAIDRCCFYLTAPKKGAPAKEEPADLIQQWEDIPWRTAMEKKAVENTLYLGDAIPSVFLNYGPGCLASMIGGSHKWAPHTVWFENEPFFVADWENPPEPRLDKQSAMYQMVETYTKALLEKGKDTFYTSITDIGGTYDIIASLRGTQNLLMDLYEYPEEVKVFAAKVASLWKEYFWSQANLLLEQQGAMTSWMPIYSEKPYYPLQCDFCAMISPEMFGEFIMPDLSYHLEYLPRSVYHLDGPGELVHLDHLLSLKNLTAIQWVPGDGAPDITDPCWYPYYERIQKAGKSLVFLGADPVGVENLLRHISTKGLFLLCNAKDEEEAKELLKIVDGYGVK